jgi:hypothetical protein
MTIKAGDFLVKLASNLAFKIGNMVAMLCKVRICVFE